ncbi:hypothetical protein DIURU_001502 [Diutina rugosa]|uniref:RNA polymerase II holoenzyme cyclin-like subunit n=1 Tax=Diutina rugosa TaxID=5481 RepID=A0A642UW13_DIURU|nr:uncharacterized protein DIURU_001502 [Diutina rugosa]KAA8905429.1 hypothetical protein DIURU_001502 [Diutina rugosa]
MSADYWASSQRSKWQMTRHQLMEARRKVLLLEKKMIQNGLIKDYANVHYDLNMRIYLHTLLVRLGRRLNIRQVALATAEVYLSRFLTRVSVKEINVYLLVMTCVYVACKVEECPQHIRLILSEARNLWPEYIPHDVTRLAEFEFYLVEEMDSYLYLHHPYNSLIQIRDFLHQNTAIYNFRLTDDELQNAWSLINDSYITDLPLFMPPHIVAAAAIYITFVLKKNMAQLRGGGTNLGSNGASSDSTGLTASSNPGGGATTVSGPSAEANMHIDDLMTLVNPGAQGGGGMSAAKDLNTMNGDDEIVKINRFMNFLTHSHINLDEVVEAMQDMVNLYVMWNRYNENTIKKALQLMLLQR